MVSGRRAVLGNGSTGTGSVPEWYETAQKLIGQLKWLSDKCLEEIPRKF